jgi:hypothetical protein
LIFLGVLETIKNRQIITQVNTFLLI